jgi:hypothetical protein
VEGLVARVVAVVSFDSETSLLTPKNERASQVERLAGPVELTSLLVLYRGPQLCNQKGPLSYRWKGRGRTCNPSSNLRLTHTRKSAIQQRYPSAHPGSVAHNNAGLTFFRPFRAVMFRMSSLVRFHRCLALISGPRDRMPSGMIRYRMSESPRLLWLPESPCKVGIIGIGERLSEPQKIRWISV